MERYSLIHTRFPREFLLLQGQGCRWRGCSFCDYHLDVSDNPFEINRPVLERVTGEYGVLDVINSGSAMEFDNQTLELIAKIVRERGIHTLWFEAHYMYRHQLAAFAERFAPAKVMFRCGVESFDGVLRQSWNKGVPPTVSPEEIARHFSGVCLLVGVEGQKREQIRRDIALASSLFDYFSVNVFCPNTTTIRRDEALVEWFTKEIYPALLLEPKAEVLMENTDLGVG
jgi:hypothetical protein